MAECHPVGFQWVTEAKLRGAKVIHVDPRFTRTSAQADRHIPIRAGSDVVLLGALINHVLSNELWFRDYVLAYTNATSVISPEFRDTEDLEGLFSGYDPELRTYDQSSWAYAQTDGGTVDEPGSDGTADTATESDTAEGQAFGEGGPPLEHHRIRKDPTLTDPHCVLNLLRRHYARYTPELVAETCGISVDDFAYLAAAVVANSGRERTTAFCYAVGWTQHSAGAQMIRTAAILQLLLGNMGRPGGGIMALRGHASIQGSTDIPTLYNLLPGYLPMPVAGKTDTLASYLDGIASKKQKGFWANADAYTISLLKAWFGDAATAENDYCFGHLPTLSGAHGTYQTVLSMLEGGVSGYFVLGQNPAVGSAHSRLQRLALAKLDWLVVRDLQMIETATFWQDAPEIETGELVTDQIGTEVFFLPAASYAEKSGTFTQTQRLLQWRHKAVEPPGDCQSELDFFHLLGQKIRERLAGSDDPRDRPLLDLTWDYPVDEHGEVDPEAVLREINGHADGELVDGFAQLRADGTSASGCWIYAGVYAGGVNRSALRVPNGGGDAHGVRVGVGVAGEPPHPLQPGLGRPRRPPVERAQEARLVGRRRQPLGGRRRARLPHRPGPRPPRRARHGRAGRPGRHRRVHHAGGRRGVAVRTQGARGRAAADALRGAGIPGVQPGVPGAGLADPRHLPPRGQPVRRLRRPTRRRGVPVRVHHLPAHRAPHGRRHVALASLPGRAPAGDVLRGLSRAGGRARPGQRWLGHPGVAAGGHRGTRARHRPDAPAGRQGPDRPPDRPALPLGRGRACCGGGRRRQRPAGARARPERPDPGVQGGFVRHQARTPTARPRGARPGGRVPASGRALTPDTSKEA